MKNKENNKSINHSQRFLPFVSSLSSSPLLFFFLFNRMHLDIFDHYPFLFFFFSPFLSVHHIQ